MDSNFTTQLTLSMLFFAPGILLFAGLAFVGVLMILEKTVFQGQAKQVLTATKLNLELPAATKTVFAKNDMAAPMPLDAKTVEVNPAPGTIVEGLKTAVAKDGAAEVAKVANGRDAGRGR